MGKKRYIRPDIREESQILTVRAFVTKTQYVLANPTTASSYALQEAVKEISNTQFAQLEAVTNTAYGLQTAITKTSYALQNVFQRLH
ncbi:MAG TPA: hypothetical protein VJ373_06495 [Desulfatiglandales bacterium]|nr:hypothetical protein [Desulfatiglandales bacterium]